MDIRNDKESENLFFSVIIPHRNSVATLSRLLDSIPNTNDIEVLVVDNSEKSLNKVEVTSKRDFILLESPLMAYSGGAINLGIDRAKGKWIIVADADDFFTTDAFDIFYAQRNSVADIVYYKTKLSAENPNTKHRETYAYLITNYLNSPSTKTITDIKVLYVVPWGKMVRKQYIIENHFRYDEIVAGYDLTISLKLALNTQKIDAVDKFVYMLTDSYNSLSKKREYRYVSATYKALLQSNQYLRQYNLFSYQRSIMYYFMHCCRYGLRPACKAIKLLFQYKQNPFIGWRNWWGTVKRLTSH